VARVGGADIGSVEGNEGRLTSYEAVGIWPSLEGAWVLRTPVWSGEYVARCWC
jgi:hypothetical protein